MHIYFIYLCTSGLNYFMLLLFNEVVYDHLGFLQELVTGNRFSFVNDVS